MTKLILRVLAVCLTLSLPSQSAASTIVDTGTPSAGFPLSGIGFGLVVFTGYFAGEFTILESYAITSIEGYFSNEYRDTDGTVDIAIHDDGGNIPGTILFSASTPMAPRALPGWYGVSGLNQVLTPGTYWASFKPSPEVTGTMPGGAPNPMIEYAYAPNGGSWVDLGADYFDYAAQGIRIQGERVPDSASTLSLFLGVALVGVVAQRLWA